MARLRLARMREEQGKADDAMPLYQAIADAKGSLVPQEEGILGLARCQETLGKPDEAMKQYRRLMNDFPDSEYAGEARTHLDAEDHS
jgi:TolA-binding protein